MKSRSFVIALLALTPAACSKDPAGPDPCKPAVAHVGALTLAQSVARGNEPSAAEKRAMGMVNEVALDACRRDGLSQAQLDCILAATDWDKFKQLATCEAIKAKPPRWLILP